MGTIQIRKTKKGKARYTAVIRKTGQKALFQTFTRKCDAEDWITQEEAKILQGICFDTLPDKSHTLSEAIYKFKTESTYHPSRIFQLDRWLNGLEDCRLANISEIQISAVLTKWKALGINGNKLAPATLNRHMDVLSLLFQAAKTWGWVKKNPVREVKRCTEPRGVVRWLSDDELGRLLEACKKSKYQPLELVVVLAISTGMRKEELMSMKWKQVNLDDGVYLLEKTKNGEPRRVNICGRALDLLRQHSKVRRIDSDFVFPSDKDTPEHIKVKTPKSERHFDVRKAWERAVKKAKIDKFRFHDLRHTTASYLAQNGASALEIAEVLGHKSLDMVQRYAHLSPSHVRKTVSNMNEKVLRSFYVKG